MLSRRCIAASQFLVAGVLLLVSPAFAQFESSDTEEEARAQQINERFLSLVKRTPRFGTALDRVYGFHVERGTLDEFVASLQETARDQPDDGTAWMLLGMIEMQRGRDADAVKAFRQAEEHRADDPLASYYLGRSLVLIGETEQAAAAYERAIEREPQKADLLEIFQALGRTYQRTHQAERALEVWDRLETLFPDDLRVQEQIAEILSDEGDHEGARTRFEKLAEKATDRYRKVQYALQAGELKIKLGRTDEAIGDFEEELAQLKPDSWLHRDVRRRIEDVFLRTDDYAGLVEYYEKWLEQNPDDLDAMTRIARALAFHGRLEEAQSWYQKAIERAPSDVRLRRALIDQLIREDKFAEAIAQYEELDRIDPNNPDHIEQWGLLILEDESRPEDERKPAAADVWRKLTESKPDDPVIASQVADLFRSAKMTDEAIALYQQAIELAPRDPQYREYLGEYYHMLERPDDAVATWKVIAEGDQRNTPNLVRLAEVYSGFGYDEPALETMTVACALDPEFADRVRFSEMLREVDRYDDALAQLAIAGEIAESPEETQLVIEERIKTYQSSGELAERTLALQEELNAGTDVTPERWRTLALYYEAGNRLADASQAVAVALEDDANSVPGWTIAARIYEKNGRIGEAADANRRLADLDRRYRTEYLKKIATLEMRLGRLDESLQAGRDLIAAAPGNPEHYQFFANLCFQLGQDETGLDALRRSVRVNPSDVSSLLTLAGALADQFRTAEAIELYWRGFEKADDLDGQIGVIGNLSELYLRTNHFDRLISRLENRGRELNQERDMTLCLASAYRSAGDLGMARDTLERLLTEDSRDTQLLTQLSQLAEQEEDFEAAVAYQRRKNSIAPDKDDRIRLANLLLKSGEIDEAEALWERLAESERESHRIFQSIKTLIGNSRYDTAGSLLERMLRQNPKNWEARFHTAVIAWKQDRKDEAEAQFRALLELDVNPDAKSAESEYREQQRRSRGGSQAASRVSVSSLSSYPPAMMRSQATYQIQRLLGVDSNRYYGSQPQTWSPTDYGQARVAAICGLYQAADERGEGDAFVSDVQERAEASIDTDAEPAWDWYHIASYLVRNTSDYVRQYEAAKLLAQRPEPAAKLMYLASLRYRYYRPGVSSRDAEKSAEPLSEDELDTMIAAYELLATNEPGWLRYGGGTEVIVKELERAERDDKAQELYESSLESANDPQSLAMAMGLAASRGDTDAVLELAEKLENHPSANRRGARNPYTQTGSIFTTLSLKRAKDDDWEDVFRFLDAHVRGLSRTYAETPPHVRRRAAGTYSSRDYVGVQVETESGDRNYHRLEYPLPDEYLDASSISYLFNVNQLCKRRDKRDELFATLKTHQQTADGLDHLFASLVLSHMSWWDDDKQNAVLALSEAAAAMPGDVSLRLRLAKLFQEQGDTAYALTIVDSVEPSDHNVLRQREIMALQLAVLSGDIERARKAAGRLFGLRLDADAQVQLAAQMHQLGMHDMAEGVLARTRRQAGNRSSTLVTLMQQYQSQGNADVAVQIAHQVLRRTSPTQNPRYRTEDSTAREQALRVLVRSGQLDKLIERVEEQLARSPGSVRLHEILADYYKAAGKTDKAQEILAKISEIKPDNAASLFQLAQQLEQSGDMNGACEKYIAAIRKDPGIFTNEYWRVQQTFQRAKRIKDLVGLMNEIDLKKLRNNYWSVMNIVQDLLRQEEQREMGLELFKRAWEAFPDQRGNLIGSIYQDDIWELPIMFEYAREGMIPASRTAVADGWQGLANSISYNNDGTVNGTVNRVMKALNSDERTETFTQEVHAGLEKYPDWHAGKVLMCLLDARAGQTDAAADRLQALLDDESLTIPSRPAWCFGSELHGKSDRLDELVIRLFEDVIKDDSNLQMNGFQHSPGRSLVMLYAKAGRRQAARDLMYDLLDRTDYSRYSSSNPGYAEYQHLQDYNTAGEQMLKLDFPVDALRLYNRATPEMINKASRWGGSHYREQLQRGRKRAEEAITPEALVKALDDWVAKPPEATGEPDHDAEIEVSGRPAKPIVDLMLDVQPVALDEAAVHSIFAQALTTAGTSGGEAAEQIGGRLEALAAEHPHDLSVHVAATLSAFAAEDEQKIQHGLDELQRLISAELSAETDSAAADIEPVNRSDVLSVWLVSREALKSEQTRAVGGELADYVFAQAERQPDNKWLLAMLRERGQLALAAGDHDAAEQHWSRMLDVILADGEQTQSEPSGAAKNILEKARELLLKSRERSP